VPTPIPDNLKEFTYLSENSDIRSKEKWYLELKRSQRLERVPQYQTRFQENPTILEEN